MGWESTKHTTLGTAFMHWESQIAYWTSNVRADDEPLRQCLLVIVITVCPSA